MKKMIGKSIHSYQMDAGEDHKTKRAMKREEELQWKKELAVESVESLDDILGEDYVVPTGAEQSKAWAADARMKAEYQPATPIVFGDNGEIEKVYSRSEFVNKLEELRAKLTTVARPEFYNASPETMNRLNITVPPRFAPETFAPVDTMEGDLIEYYYKFAHARTPEDIANKTKAREALLEKYPNMFAGVCIGYTDDNGDFAHFGECKRAEPTADETMLAARIQARADFYKPLPGPTLLEQFKAYAEATKEKK
jgi:hypothetical protein